MHLEWEDINFDEFIENITELLIDTNWRNNAVYPHDITINQATNMRIMGYDAGLMAAVMLRPPNTNFRAWREYYIFVIISRYGDFSLTV